MSAYFVTDSDGKPLGEFTADEILEGWRTNSDIRDTVAWSQTLILTTDGRSLSLYDFLRSVYPELFAGIPLQPDDPEPNIHDELEEMETTPLGKLQAYRNLDFKWCNDSWSVSVMGSDGCQIGLLDLERLKDLIDRGVLPLNHEVTVNRVEDREINWEGLEVIHYLPEEQCSLSEVVAELQGYQDGNINPPQNTPSTGNCNKKNNIITEEKVEEIRAKFRVAFGQSSPPKH